MKSWIETFAEVWLNRELGRVDVAPEHILFDPVPAGARALETVYMPGCRPSIVHAFEVTDPHREVYEGIGVGFEELSMIVDVLEYQRCQWRGFSRKVNWSRSIIYPYHQVENVKVGPFDIFVRQLELPYKERQ